jgi:hypothetical protein
MTQQKIMLNIGQMIKILPKALPKTVYACKGSTCLCVEYLDLRKEEHRRIYKNCFITSLK